MRKIVKQRGLRLSVHSTPLLSSQLQVPARTNKFVLVGTPEDKTFKDPHQVGLTQFSDVADSFDVVCEPCKHQPFRIRVGLTIRNIADQDSDAEARLSPAEDPRNIRLIAQKLSDYPVNVRAFHLGMIPMHLVDGSIDRKRIDHQSSSAGKKIACSRSGLQ